MNVLEHPEENEGTENLVKSHLMDRLSLPVLAMEELAVQEIIHTPAGETVLDFGQNFAGFVEFDAAFPKGTKITLECAEILQEGNFYHGNYRDAVSKFTYISDGTAKKSGPILHFSDSAISVSPDGRENAEKKRLQERCCIRTLSGPDISGRTMRRSTACMKIQCGV